MQRPISFIIVDDDPMAISDIEKIIKPFVSWKLKATFTQARDALKYLRDHHVDFILLDMEMPEIDGKSLILQLPKEVKVIIHTSYDQYATDGFENDAVDFLKKPVSIERFNKAMNKMGRTLKYTIEEGKLVKGDYYYFMLKGPKKNVRTRINLDELVYIEILGNRSHFHTVNTLAPGSKGQESAHRLHELQEMLEGTNFVPIYRSILLNKDFYGSYEERKVKIKGFPIWLPTGDRNQYKEFFDWTDISNLPNFRDEKPGK